MSDHISLENLLIQIALIWGISKVLNIFLSKFKLPSVLAELFCGVLFGLILLLSPANSWFHGQIQSIKQSEILFILGEIGIILLLFEIGLETEFNKIISVGKEATLVALGGVTAPFIFIYLTNYIFHFNWDYKLCLFLGLVFAATSIGVTARVFQDLKILNTLNAQIVLGAAVLDDIIGLILLSVLSGLLSSTGSTFSLVGTLLIILKASLFLGLSIWLGGKISGKFIPWIGNLGRYDPWGLMIWVLIFAFVLSYLAALAGLAPIIGAFAAGITLDRIKIEDSFGETKKIDDFIAPIIKILTPIFFVKIGLSIDLKELLSFLPLLLTLVACVSKIISGYLFLPFKTSFNRLIVGVGMMPRGEVGLVIAAIGSQLGILTGNIYSAALIAVILTTLIAPIWLQIILKKD